MGRWLSFVALVTACCGDGEQADVDAPGEDADDGGEISEACAEAEIAAAEHELRTVVAGASRCFTGWVVVDEDRGAEARFDARYGWWDFRLASCNVHPWTTWYEPARMFHAVWEAIHSWRAPCPHLAVYVAGGADADVWRMGEEIELTCGVVWDAFFIVEIDAEGRVADVYGDARTTELVECIRIALSDDLFPCLATTQLCPSYVRTS